VVDAFNFVVKGEIVVWRYNER